MTRLGLEQAEDIVLEKRRRRCETPAAAGGRIAGGGHGSLAQGRHGLVRVMDIVRSIFHLYMQCGDRSIL